MGKAQPLTVKTMVLLILCLFCFDPALVMSETYKVGVLDFPPFFIVKNNTDVSGSLTDVIRKTLNKAGIAYEINGYPPKRLFKNLADGTTQIWMGIKGVPDYDGRVLFGSVQTETIEIRLYGLENIPLPKTLDELKGKNIITLRGYGYGGLIGFLDDPQNNIGTDETDGHELAFRKLMKRRCDYLLDYKEPAEILIRKKNYKGIIYSVIDSLKVQFIVSKKTPGAENLLKRIEEAYLALKKDGAIK
jgi:polar amino acid transport system substrate-binding protein